MHACGSARKLSAEPLYRPFAVSPNKANKVCKISFVSVASICFFLLISLCGGQVPNDSLTSRYAISVEQLRIQPKVLRHLSKAEQDFRKMRLREAVVEVEQALRVDPTCGQAFTMKALVELSLRDNEAAFSDATRAVELDRNNALSFLALATAHNARGDFAEAERVAREALRLQPTLWQARLELAKGLYGREEMLDALDELEMVHIDFADVHLVRGNILTRLDRRREAASEFTIFLRQAPNDPRAEQIRRIIGIAQSPDALF